MQPLVLRRAIQAEIAAAPAAVVAVAQDGAEDRLERRRVDEHRPLGQRLHAELVCRLPPERPAVGLLPLPAVATRLRIDDAPDDPVAAVLDGLEAAVVQHVPDADKPVSLEQLGRPRGIARLRGVDDVGVDAGHAVASLELLAQRLHVLAVVGLVAAHVPGGVEMNEEADAGDDAQHHQRQLVQA